MSDAESRQRKRIRAAVESRGFRVDTLTWEHHYPGGEKSGICGGWSLTVDRNFLANTYPGNDLYGLSADELLAEVDYWLQPPESCDCDRTHSAIAAASVLGDPEQPTHRVGCRWHLRYRLPWWGRATEATS